MGFCACGNGSATKFALHKCFSVKVDMMTLVYFTGRDIFKDGKGSMIIKILSLINVVNDSDNEKLNQVTLQRYLGEIIWFPTAAVSPYIK